MPVDKSLKLLADRSRLAYHPAGTIRNGHRIGALGARAKFASAGACVPFDRMSKSVLVATANPFNKQAAADLEDVDQTPAALVSGHAGRFDPHSGQSLSLILMPPVKSLGERIADALVEDGLLTGAQVEELLEKQKKEGTRFIKLVVEKAYVTENDLVVSMGRVLNTPPVNVTRARHPAGRGRIGAARHGQQLQGPARLPPGQQAVPGHGRPAQRPGRRRRQAHDQAGGLAADRLRKGHPGQAGQSRQLAARQAWRTSSRTPPSRRKPRRKRRIWKSPRRPPRRPTSPQLAASSEEAPVIKLANLILVQAIKDRASDIHIEPFENMVRLRYRVDGGLIDMPPPPKNLQVALTSRIKVMSSLDIAERRLPQDGRMRVRVGGRDVDLRVSFLPTVHGEKCVLRVLDKSNLSASMDKLGIDPETFIRFKAAVDAPHGLILVTGPTGSGKTTTLYSALNELNSPQFNIVTVEDPVEFQLPGVNQVPVKKEIGLTFANALRSILRQDPDIIMIGEIRDTETAEIAVESALTGHQVLSTMHCNDAPGAISRLDDMEIAPFLISSSVILACAQRLMRRICSSCKEPVDLSGQNVPGPGH